MQSSSRNGARVRVFCLHTTEGIMRAADLRDWTGWAGSSHAAADETGVLLSGAADGFVDYSRASWTLRNGNPWSDNLEQCGFAGWTRAQWLARPKLLEAAARWLADRHRARPDVPLRRLSVMELAAGHSGVIDHDTYTKATRDGTHWDCGPNYPWDVVIPRAQALANGEDVDEMTPQQAVALAECRWLIGQMKPVLDSVSRLLADEDAQTDKLTWGVLDPSQGLRVQVAGVAGQVAGLAEAMSQLSGGSGGTVDLAAVQEAAAAGTRSVFAQLADDAPQPTPSPQRAVAREQLRSALERTAAGPSWSELEEFIGPLYDTSPRPVTAGVDD
jgi:hypothetical protein